MNIGNYLTCFIAGAVAGCVAGLLLAPESGEKTRKRLAEGASEMAGKARDKILEKLKDVEVAVQEEE